MLWCDRHQKRAFINERWTSYLMWKLMNIFDDDSVFLNQNAGVPRVINLIV